MRWVFTHRIIRGGRGVRRREWLRTRWGWWLPVRIAFRKTKWPKQRVWFSQSVEDGGSWEALVPLSKSTQRTE